MCLGRIRGLNYELYCNINIDFLLLFIILHRAFSSFYALQIRGNMFSCCTAFSHSFFLLTVSAPSSLQLVSWSCSKASTSRSLHVPCLFITTNLGPPAQELVSLAPQPQPPLRCIFKTLSLANRNCCKHEFTNITS